MTLAGLVLVVGTVLVLTWDAGDRPDQAQAPPEGVAAEGSTSDGATADERATSTTTAGDRTASPGIITGPGEGVAPDDPGDPGGWQQVLAFGVVVVGLAGVGFGIWRSARRARRRA